MKEKVKYGFGPHLMFDLYGCNKEKLSDMDLIFDTLDKFPTRMGMNKIMPPYVFKYTGSVPEDWGISGVVLIAESHITIHTFPDKDHAFIDIFSCKDFNTDFATSYMINLFEAKEHEVSLSARGAEFKKTTKHTEPKPVEDLPRIYTH
ncbi:MAG: S-adenosylmethionine decarboxylase [Candidatus Saganbacteria bacterium]|uniref:S-adenosylmethionine decarboxylase n=1 Tax=Candidatus Saganbacteria bacterium TaxID=2575572 RepID=A0A833L050_UNCSA|nr:MAG: S-adenosylmethionine decarboxylase [Candidatus Saganbacteria bacterium]